MDRKKIVAANWKMNLLPEEAAYLMKKLCVGLPSELNTEVIIAPPFLYFDMLNDLSKDCPIHLAAQNVHQEVSGAFTGEISPVMLEKIGVSYVLIGHSERRIHFKETDDILAQKVSTALASGLKVIFCVGEGFSEREENRHEAFVKKQLERGVFHLRASTFEKLVIAYEPVWAIGTGKTASKEQAQQMHAFIRTQVAQVFSRQVADKIPILYGGSCKPQNAFELFSQADIDGGLIGGASLDSEHFLSILSIMERNIKA